MIFGTVSEMYAILKDYYTGKLNFWPFGVEIAAIIMVGLGIYLIKKGINKRNSIK